MLARGVAQAEVARVLDVFLRFPELGAPCTEKRLRKIKQATSRFIALQWIPVA